MIMIWRWVRATTGPPPSADAAAASVTAASTGSVVQDVPASPVGAVSMVIGAPGGRRWRTAPAA